jgi:hypothetical protein
MLGISASVSGRRQLSLVIDLAEVLAPFAIGRDGNTITNESSVSRCADRELRLVEPKRVRIGSDLDEGDNQIPESATSEKTGGN